MSAVAVIPARGGSKGVPRKNLRPVGGVPLVVRAIRAAQAAGIERVIVSTDDEEIAATARAAGADAFPRPAEIAGDTASSESALLDVLDRLAAAGEEPDVLAFLQATSPFIDADALGRAVARVAGGEDVVFSAFPTYAFLWRSTAAGAVGVNHDAAHRPRRQDREAHWQETGAFYVLSVPGFRAAGHRFFGRVGIEPVPEDAAIEIDDAAQLALAGLLARAHPLPGDGVVDVDAVVMDFDGVHTDDAALVGADGMELVRVSRADGLGVERLRRAGVRLLILSKERHPVVAARAAKLRVDVLQGVDDKASALETWCREQGVSLERTAYVGNDVNDVPALRLAGWPVVPRDADPAVLPLARLVLTHDGGNGAVRELAEKVLAARGEEE